MNTPFRILRRVAVNVCAVGIAMVSTVLSAQIPPNPTPWPGPPGSYQGTIRFVVFTAFGNNQHATQSCYIDGAFVALNGIIPAFGQAPYGQMAVLRAHPNYNDMIATLLAAKVAGMTVDIQLIRDPTKPNTNQYPPLYAPAQSPGGCDLIPIVGAVGLLQ